MNGLTELHVCTTRIINEAKQWEQTWLCLELNQDVKTVLTEYKRLPETNVSLHHYMDLMDKQDELLLRSKENKDLKVKVAEL